MKEVLRKYIFTSIVNAQFRYRHAKSVWSRCIDAFFFARLQLGIQALLVRLGQGAAMTYLVILLAIGLSVCASKPNFPQAGIRLLGQR